MYAYTPLGLDACLSVVLLFSSTDFDPFSLPLTGLCGIVRTAAADDFLILSDERPTEGSLWDLSPGWWLIGLSVSLSRFTGRPLPLD